MSENIKDMKVYEDDSMYQVFKDKYDKRIEKALLKVEVYYFKNKEGMTIKELSKKYGRSCDTIKQYIFKAGGLIRDAEDFLVQSGNSGIIATGFVTEPRLRRFTKCRSIEYILGANDEEIYELQRLLPEHHYYRNNITLFLARAWDFANRVLCMSEDGLDVGSREDEALKKFNRSKNIGPCMMNMYGKYVGRSLCKFERLPVEQKYLDALKIAVYASHLRSDIGYEMADVGRIILGPVKYNFEFIEYICETGNILRELATNFEEAVKTNNVGLGNKACIKAITLLALLENADEYSSFYYYRNISKCMKDISAVIEAISNIVNINADLQYYPGINESRSILVDILSDSKALDRIEILPFDSLRYLCVDKSISLRRSTIQIYKGYKRCPDVCHNVERIMCRGFIKYLHDIMKLDRNGIECLIGRYDFISDAMEDTSLLETANKIVKGEVSTADTFKFLTGRDDVLESKIDYKNLDNIPTPNEIENQPDLYYINNKMRAHHLARSVATAVIKISEHGLYIPPNCDLSTIANFYFGKYRHHLFFNAYDWECLLKDEMEKQV